MALKVHALTMATALGAVALNFSTGCNGPCHKAWTANDLNAEKQDEIKSEHVTQDDHWDNMADNAMVSDMAIADHHFVPHTSELSGTGAEKLSRLAPYLDTYGGTVRYDTSLTDDKLVDQRMAHVKEYIETTGADMSRVEVAVMMPGGRMLAASQAIKADDRGTAKPSGGSSLSTVIGPSPNP